MTERTDYRTGIEGWDGRPLRWRPTPTPCFHYCAAHDHLWPCGDPRCNANAILLCGKEEVA